MAHSNLPWRSSRRSAQESFSDRVDSRVAESPWNESSRVDAALHVPQVAPRLRQALLASATARAVERPVRGHLQQCFERAHRVAFRKRQADAQGERPRAHSAVRLSPIEAARVPAGEVIGEAPSLPSLPVAPVARGRNGRIGS